MELELDLLYDDAVWEWTDDHYEKGLFPSAFLDEGVPDAYIRVYRCSGVGGLLGPLGNSLRRLIGFNRCSVRELLGVGVALPDAQGRRMESLCNDNLAQDLDCNDKRNIILNKVAPRPPAAQPHTARGGRNPKGDNLPSGIPAVGRRHGSDRRRRSTARLENRPTSR